jgi:putative selenate reductase molybdopterin-binding subunit
MELELRLNGIVESLEVTASESLLSMLRREGYDSVKRGCETGECGACTVLVDGVPRPSCTMLAAQASGCTLTTVEKLRSERQLHPLQLAFVEVGAVQCGFCTPGMLLSAYALLKRNPRPTEIEVREALSGHLCHCGGYVKPVQAVLRAAMRLRGEAVPPLDANRGREEGSSVNLTLTGRLRTVVAQGVSSTTGKFSVVKSGAPSATSAEAQLHVVGKPIPAISAVKLASGNEAFVEDVHPRDMLYAHVLTSPHAHAILRSIDVDRAKALPGVHAVLTYKNVPRVAYSRVERLADSEGPYDAYCLDYHMRYAGDRVAVVAAETPEIAEQALQLIHVEYDVRPPLLDARQALEASAVRVHPESESRGISDATRNIAARVRVEVGDIERGFAASDAIVEGEYVLPQMQAVPLEKHTVISYIDADDYLVVRTSTQVPHYVRRVLASLLELPQQRIRVVQPHVGGDFGGKQQIVLEDLCALLTIMTNRPIMLAYSHRDELTSYARQAQVIRVKTGVKRDGTILAQQMIVLANTGAYATHPLTTKNNVAAQCLALYPSANMRFAAEVVYTNTPPSGAFRGYGMPEASFALESHMDEVAKRLGMDALALRRKNWATAGSQLALTEPPMGIESCGLPACLQLVEEKLQWRERRGRSGNARIRKGVGIALALHTDSEENLSGAMLKLNEDGSCDLFAPTNGESGFATLLAQIAAEALGLSIEAISLHNVETNLVPASLGSSFTALFYSSGGAVKRAAEQLRQQVARVAAQMLHVSPDMLRFRAGTITADERTITIAQVVSHALSVEHHHLMATASWQQRTPTTFAAHGAEVEVDTETGGVRVTKMITAVDVGRVLNPSLTEGLIQGHVAQGLGMVLGEELLYNQRGVPTPTIPGSSHTLTMPEMSEMHTYLVETHEPTGPFGAKAITAVALSGVAAAVSNAVTDALSIRLRQLPLTPERVLRAISTQGVRKS